MTVNVSLPPDLEQFVREQLATGRFTSEADITSAALRLLKRSLHQSAIDPASPTDATNETPKRQSLFGILADIGSNLSYEDFKAARRELWCNYPCEDI
jgi:Arc/MetJ-type ribon-helix-helix transcriptional regulator